MGTGRLLICLKTYLGDAVMASPAIDALQRRYPDVAIQTSSPVAELLQASGRRFLPSARSRRPWASVRAAAGLRRQGFDAVVLVNRSFRAAWVARLAGIPVRVGHGREGGAALLTHRVPYDPKRFEAETVMDLARALGCEAPAVPDLALSEDERLEGARLLGGAQVGLQPGARWAGKRIPLDVLVEVADALSARGARLALLGGPEELPMAEAVLARIAPDARMLVGKTSIRGTLGLLSGLGGMVGPDSGLMHMAAAVRCPTVTVFGPTDDDKWAHRYAPHRVVVAPERDMERLAFADLWPTVETLVPNP